MVNVGPLTAEIGPVVWGTPANFNGFRVLAALLHGTQVVGVSQTAALNRGRRLYSAGRPSSWALAHILVIVLRRHCTRIWGNNAKLGSLRRSRPFKVTDFGTNRLPISE